MTDMFLERIFEPNIDEAAVLKMSVQASDCFGMHQVAWRGSLLSSGGNKMLCCFQAPDMESARIAMRQSEVDTRVFWHGTVHDAPGIGQEDLRAANVLVERSFDVATPLQQIQEIEDAGIHCLEARNVRFIRTFYSTDRQRMVCLYEAPDAESVRQAQREAGVPFVEAWSFRALGPWAEGPANS